MYKVYVIFCKTTTIINISIKLNLSFYIELNHSDKSETFFQSIVTQRFHTTMLQMRVNVQRQIFFYIRDRYNKVVKIFL